MKTVTRHFRLNCGPKERDKVLDLLAEEGFSCQEPGGGDEIMRALEEPYPVGNSLAHYFGYIYVQDISSMLPAMLLDPVQGSMVLDMCASPGGKTGQLARQVGPGGVVVANEPNPSRLATLRANLKRLNLINVITSGYRGSVLAEKKVLFDNVLLDVPCSGWGTLNKNPRAARIWKGEKITTLTSVQRGLLEAAARLIRPGGRIVYSTCTTNELENEAQIQWALGNLSLTGMDTDKFNSVPDGFPRVEKTGPGMLRVRGSKCAGQDFFMAAMIRSPENRSEDRISNSPVQKTPGEPVAIDMDIRQPVSGDFWNYSGNLFFVPSRAWEYLEAGLSAQGSFAGRVKGKKVFLSPRMRILLPGYAWGKGYNTRDLEQVKKLVRGQSLDCLFSDNLVGLYWNGLGLGWLKSRNNRLFWSDR